MLLQLAYLSVTNAFALLRLLPIDDQTKDAETLALRHQITILERQLGRTRPRFSPADRAFHPLPPPITDQAQIIDLDIRRQQRLGGILNEYHHAA